ncbi:MAG: hypothetical protein QM811_22590 [Pirellulales bacterium]
MSSELVVMEYLYPNINRYRVPVYFQQRRGLVLSERNLNERPLSDLALWRRPDLRRSERLFLVWDFEKQQYRKFYEGSMRRIRTSKQQVFQIGMFDPMSDAPPKMYGPIVTDLQADLKKARDFIKVANEWLSYSRHGFVAQLFPFVQVPSRQLVA